MPHVVQMCKDAYLAQLAELLAVHLAEPHSEAFMGMFYALAIAAADRLYDNKLFHIDMKNSIHFYPKCTHPIVEETMPSSDSLHACTHSLLANEKLITKKLPLNIVKCSPHPIVLDYHPGITTGIFDAHIAPGVTENVQVQVKIFKKMCT
ncbi:hypothetical protein RSAG8_11445, partial [Rhizoctonia solani AG-8 WAC10335]